MAAKAEDAPPIPAAAAPPIDSSPHPALDPAPRGARKAEEEEEREDPPREPKRRRTCPAALETTLSPAVARVADGDEGGSSLAERGEASSFSFDTRGFVAPVETTPKFGRFHFPVTDLEAAAAAVESEAVAETAAEVDGAGDQHDADESQIGSH